MKYVIYLICVILITMFLVYIGSIKDRNLPIELTQKLYLKCANKVMKYLKRHDYATMYDIQNMINGVETSLLWSRKHVSVQKSIKFSQYVIEKLCKENKIKIEVKGNKKIFKLSK